MTRIKRALRRLAIRFAAARGVTLVDTASLATAANQLADVENFSMRSGFLRDGRYPGGRHAERKFRAGAKAAGDSIERSILVG